MVVDIEPFEYPVLLQDQYGLPVYCKYQQDLPIGFNK